MAETKGPVDRLKRQNRLAAVGMGLMVFFLLTGTAAHYGLTFDEPVYISRALRVGQWLQLLGTAPGEALSQPVIDRYWDPAGDEQAGLMKIIGWTASMAFMGKTHILTTMRAGTIVVCSVFFALFYLWVSGIWGRREALFAALGLLFMPRVFAHTHLYALDAPVMVFSFLSVAAGLLYARGLDTDATAWHKGRIWLILCGVAFGAAIACKINGFMVPLILLPWLLLYRRRALLPIAASLAVGGTAIFFLSWPWLWFDTGARLARYAAFFGQHYPVGVTYFGTNYTYAPWHFAPVMLLITTPPLILFFAASAWVRSAAEYIRSRAAVDGSHVKTIENRQWSGKELQSAALVLMTWTVVIHLLPLCLPSTPKYNGVRLFLPVFPALAVVAAVGFGFYSRRLMAWLEEKWREFPAEEMLRRRRLTVGLLLFLAIVPSLYATAMTHPWQMSYYNVGIGGLAGAARAGMEVTYWGETYMAALPWLNQHAPSGAFVWINIPGFASSVAMYQEFGMLRRDLQIVAGPEAFTRADLCVVANKVTEYGEQGALLVAKGTPLFTEEIDGVPLVWVFPGPAHLGLLE